MKISRIAMAALAALFSAIVAVAAAPFASADYPIVGRLGSALTMTDSVGQVDNYLSLNTYGVYSCCHGIIKLGEPEQDIGVLYERMRSTEAECRSCSMFPCQ